MWQTWSRSDLAGEPNTNGDRPPTEKKQEANSEKACVMDERIAYDIGVWGDEEAVTDNEWGRNKKKQWRRKRMSVEWDRREWYMQGLFIAEEKQGEQLVSPLQIAFFCKRTKRRKTL